MGGIIEGTFRGGRVCPGFGQAQNSAPVQPSLSQKAQKLRSEIFKQNLFSNIFRIIFSLGEHWSTLGKQAINCERDLNVITSLTRMDETNPGYQTEIDSLVELFPQKNRDREKLENAIKSVIRTAKRTSLVASTYLGLTQFKQGVTQEFNRPNRSSSHEPVARPPVEIYEELPNVDPVVVYLNQIGSIIGLLTRQDTSEKQIPGIIASAFGKLFSKEKIQEVIQNILQARQDPLLETEDRQIELFRRITTILSGGVFTRDENKNRFLDSIRVNLLNMENPPVVPETEKLVNIEPPKIDDETANLYKKIDEQTTGE